MNNHTSYYMRDQVDNLIPSLMRSDTGKQRGRLLELAVFVVTTLGYLVALGLTA